MNSPPTRVDRVSTSIDVTCDKSTSTHSVMKRNTSDPNMDEDEAEEVEDGAEDHEDRDRGDSSNKAAAAAAAVSGDKPDSKPLCLCIRRDRFLADSYIVPTRIPSPLLFDHRYHSCSPIAWLLLRTLAELGARRNRLAR
jgi:hypothetical protein